MGSTLETALVFPVILLVIVGFTVWPLGTAKKAYSDFLDGAEEIDSRSAEDASISCEDLNTFVCGVSDNYRIIYGGFLDAVLGEE